MHLYKRKESFIIFPILILSQVISINFWQIWHFGVKDTGWVDLPQVSVILIGSAKIPEREGSISPFRFYG